MKDAVEIGPSLHEPYTERIACREQARAERRVCESRTPPSTTLKSLPTRPRLFKAPMVLPLFTCGRIVAIHPVDGAGVPVTLAPSPAK